MHFTSSPRRALGLLAVGALGMSTAIVGVAGTASAARDFTAPYTFSTDAGAEVDFRGVSSIEIQDEGCVIAWVIDGAAGGNGWGSTGAVSGSSGGRYTVTTSAAKGDEFGLFPGDPGDDASADGFGRGGRSFAPFPGANGEDGAVVGRSSGGGGAASIVTQNGVAFLGVHGGNAGNANNDMERAGEGGLRGQVLDISDGTDGTRSGAPFGPGVISGSVTCGAADSGDPVAPSAPTLAEWVQVGDGTATFQFTPGSYGRDATGHEFESSFEYKLDTGAWTPFTTSYTGTSDLTGTLTGLTNLKKYSLSVRATSDAGTSAASASVTFTPFRAVAAPAGVSAAVGISSVRISWTPAADATGTAKYIAYATPEGAQSSAETAECVTADASATTCTVGVKPGRAYWYGVVGVDAAGNEGSFLTGETVTAVVPGPTVPANLPKADGTLQSDAKDGKAIAGGQVVISGTGFLPGSTVALIVYSTPVKLGEAVVLADGTFSATVTLPKELADGVHNLVATGVDANGNVRNLVVEVTVSGGTAVLANTGFSALPYAGAGALALLAGGGLLFAARRRSAA